MPTIILNFKLPRSSHFGLIIEEIPVLFTECETQIVGMCFLLLYRAVQDSSSQTSEILTNEADSQVVSKTDITVSLLTVCKWSVVLERI